MKCSCCGTEITAQNRFCPHCGQNNEFYVEPPVQQPTSYTPPTYNQPNNYNNGYNNYNQSNNYNNPVNYNNQNYNNGYNNYNQYNQPNNYNNSYNNSNQYPNESGALAVCAIIFSILGGWVGLLLTIIGLATYKNPSHRAKCKVALGILIAWFVFGFIIGLSMA